MKTNLAKLIRSLTMVSGFLGSRRGNVAILSAFLMMPLVFASGMGVDYTLAARRQDQLQGFADAAALAGVTPAMMAGSAANSQAAAQSMFLAQAQQMSGINFQPSNLTVTAVDTATANTVKRTVTVNYSAASTNTFSSILGVSTIAIGGSASSASSASPNTDFYLLLDTSPSMEIVASTAGMNTLKSYSPGQDSGAGCAFGCHEIDSPNNLGNAHNVPCVIGSGYPIPSWPNGGEDNYNLARCLGLPLRIDLVNAATQNLMSVAQTMATQNTVTYRAALYTADITWKNPQSLTSNLSAVGSAAANLQPFTMYSNNHLVSGDSNGDMDTTLDASIASTSAAMPAPGNGTNTQGDTPQEVMFIVTDGVNDVSYNGGRNYAPIGTLYSSGVCAAVKARNIRIAVLYLTYNPMTSDSWYNTYIAPIQNNIAPAAQACASSGLYFQVNTDSDISSAMTALFQKVIATARLTH